MTTSQSDSTPVKVELEGGVLRITLNRPEVKNALSPAMAAALAEVFSSARKDASIKAVLLSGEGGNFCSGGDVRQMGEGVARTAEQRYAGMQTYRNVATELAAFDRPIVCALDGVAYGAGFAIALLADMILVSSRVRMCMVFHRIGLVPDLGAFYTLPRVVGLQKAKELVFSAREIGAQEAVQLGIAMQSHDPEDLYARALEVALSFTGASSAALRLSKQALNASLQSDFSTMLEMEATAQALAGNSEYAQESVRRFRAKEPAQFIWPSPEPLK